MNELIHPLIIKRRSIFSFLNKEVEKEKLTALFTAAGMAPSSFNAQPWGFIYATKRHPEQYSKMASLLSDKNKTWALSAPVLVLSLAELFTEERKKLNTYAFHDLGMATENFIFQATYMGLYVHPMGGYDKEMSKSLLKIPPRFEPGAMVAVGYPGPDEDLPADLKKRLLTAGKRKGQEEFVRMGSW